MAITVEGTQREVASHARRHGPWIVRLARMGYAAKGIIYLVIGGLAVRLALGDGGGATDSRGALQAISDGTGGRLLLLFMAVGLVGYAFWAVLAALLDTEERGGGAKGAALRTGQAGRGVAYGALGIEALRLVTRAWSSSGGSGADHWSARVMDLPWGRALLAGVGVGIMAYALYQFWRGARKDLDKHLRLGGAEPEVMRWVMRLARFGIIARGLVFLVIGGFIVLAAWRSDAGQAGGIRESLTTLGSQPHGQLLLGSVAFGLIGYGVWQLANARYREMQVG